MEEKENLIGEIFKLKREVGRPTIWRDAEGALVPLDHSLLYCRNEPHPTGTYACFLDLVEHREILMSFMKIHHIELWIKKYLEKIN